MAEDKEKSQKKEEASLEQQLRELLQGSLNPPAEEPPAEKKTGEKEDLDILEIPLATQPTEPKRPEAPAPLSEASTSPLTEQLASLLGKPPTPKKPGVAQHPGPSTAPTPTLEPLAREATPPPTPTTAESRVAEAFGILAIEGPRPRLSLFSLSLLQKRLITLSLEGPSLRVLTLRGSSIETWASVPVEPRLSREGYLVDVPGLGEAISHILKTRKIGAGRVLCSFTSLGSIYRVLSLPSAARQDLDSTVPRELRRAGINVNNYSLSWQALPSKFGPVRVFAVGVPREQVVALVEALRAARLKPAALDLKPLALARAINKKDAIIAHGERDAIELALVVGDEPSLMRSVYLGAETNPDLVATRLTDELIRTIDFYNATHRENPLDPLIPVYLTGEIALYPGVAGGLAQSLSREVGSLEPPLKLPPDFPAPLFMVNIGLALRNL